MTALDRLLAQLEARGLSVRPGAEPGQLLLAGPTAEKTQSVIDAVKAFKPQLLERVGEREAVAPPVISQQQTGERCRVCGRAVDAEDRERLAGVNPLCDRGGSMVVTDGNGVKHTDSQRCPHKN